MASLLGSHIHEYREELKQRREEIRRMHVGGATSAQVVTALTALIDHVVSKLGQHTADEVGGATQEAFYNSIALVALGGYGRAELAPFSDVDLLFLYDPRSRHVAGEFCDRLVRDLWDVGLVLGTSLRSISECTELARSDLSIHTALLEARHVVGASWLTTELRDRVSRLTHGRHCTPFIRAALAERGAEQSKFGSIVHLLEPDVKKSRGGLREIHLFRWVAHARYGQANIDALESDGVLSASDADALRQARDFLFRARNELHFQAGRAQDTLTLDEQVRLAEVFGVHPRPGLLAVELFMQQYYRHVDAVDEITRRFVTQCQGESRWSRLKRWLAQIRLGHDFVLSGNEMMPVASAEAKSLGSLEGIVHLFLLANQFAVSIGPSVRAKIPAALAKLNEHECKPACKKFLEMLATPGHLDRTLHEMHSLRILERLIPDFGHVWGLIQFNQYHKYTVDEHTLLCVANVEKLLRDKGPLGQVYREIRHKEILHLALLLHDLGKGYDGDHSEIGHGIALRAAERFDLTPHQREVLVFVVHQHLLMSHLAFRRDTSDEQVVADFARRVGSPEVLKMLFVFTAADIQSVGPETWTSWKGDVLADFYARTLEMLTGRMTPGQAENRVAEVRAKVIEALSKSVPEDWLVKHLETFRRSCLLATPVEQIVEHLHTLSTLPPGDVLTTGIYDPATRITAYTVYTFDDITPGLFAKITGVLAAKGLQILSAQIFTHPDGEVVDRFEVLDGDYPDQPPAGRATDICTTIRAVLLGQRAIEELFTHRYRLGPSTRPPPASHLEPTKVVIDNETSDVHTIIEVFAHDRQGLLYVIARTIFELGLVVSAAKIATSLDQVLDVFYVSCRAGRKVTDEGRLEAMSRQLVQAIETFEVPRRSGFPA